MVQLPQGSDSAVSQEGETNLVFQLLSAHQKLAESACTVMRRYFPLGNTQKSKSRFLHSKLYPLCLEQLLVQPGYSM